MDLLLPMEASSPCCSRVFTNIIQRLRANFQSWMRIFRGSSALAVFPVRGLVAVAPCRACQRQVSCSAVTRLCRSRICSPKHTSATPGSLLCWPHTPQHVSVASLATRVWCSASGVAEQPCYPEVPSTLAFFLTL